MPTHSKQQGCFHSCCLVYLTLPVVNPILSLYFLSLKTLNSWVLLEDKSLMEKFLLFPDLLKHGCWPGLLETKRISDKLHVHLWDDLPAGSHLTGLGLGGMLQISYILSVRGLSSVWFANQPTHYAPLHPHTPPEGILLYWPVCIIYRLLLLCFSFSLPLGELRVRVEIPGPAASDQITRSLPALHLRGCKHQHMCASTPT